MFTEADYHARVFVQWASPMRSVLAVGGLGDSVAIFFAHPFIFLETVPFYMFTYSQD